MNPQGAIMQSVQKKKNYKYFGEILRIAQIPLERYKTAESI